MSILLDLPVLSKVTFHSRAGSCASAYGGYGQVSSKPHPPDSRQAGGGGRLPTYLNILWQEAPWIWLRLMFHPGTAGREGGGIWSPWAAAHLTSHQHLIWVCCSCVFTAGALTCDSCLPSNHISQPLSAFIFCTSGLIPIPQIYLLNKYIFLIHFCPLACPQSLCHLTKLVCKCQVSPQMSPT